MGSPTLELVRVEDAHKAALQQGAQALARLLGVSVPEGWPQFPEAFSPDAPPQPADWPAFFFVDRARGALVGNGGFAGSLNAEGEIEIGYEVAPAHQVRGYATAAARARVAMAFSRPGIRAVVAHTLAEENASTGVLRRIGMAKVAELPNPEVGTVWKWRVAKAG